MNNITRTRKSYCLTTLRIVFGAKRDYIIICRDSQHRRRVTYRSFHGKRCISTCNMEQLNLVTCDKNVYVGERKYFRVMYGQIATIIINYR